VVFYLSGIIFVEELYLVGFYFFLGLVKAPPWVGGGPGGAEKKKVLKKSLKWLIIQLVLLRRKS